MSETTTTTTTDQHRILCGFNTHFLDPDHVFLTDAKLIDFLKLANREFRASWPVCRKCAKSLELSYRIKKRRAIRNYKRSQLLDVSSVTISENSAGPEYAVSSQQSNSSLTTAASETDEELNKAAAARARARRAYERQHKSQMKNYISELIGG